MHEVRGRLAAAREAGEGREADALGSMLSRGTLDAGARRIDAEHAGFGKSVAEERSDVAHPAAVVDDAARSRPRPGLPPGAQEGDPPASEEVLPFSAQGQSLQEKLSRWRERVTDVRYEIKYRTITREMDRVLIAYRYSASFRIAYDEEDQRWSRRIGENRLVLLYDDIQTRYYVLSGM